MRTYENKYGKLVVEPLTEFKPVSSIRGEDVPNDCKFDLETAEKIALITDNRRSQLAFGPKDRQGYLVIHESASSACAVRIVEMDYIGPNAQEEIRRRAESAIL